MSAITTADRLHAKRKFGIFTHFLAHNEPGGWDETVNNFDVPALAKNLSDIGAGWYFITLMQGRRYMCAPNAAFDAIAGTRPDVKKEKYLHYQNSVCVVRNTHFTGA